MCCHDLMVMVDIVIATERRVSIAGLLLDDASNRLVMIASGYSHRYRYDYIKLHYDYNGLKPVLVLGDKDKDITFY